MKRAQYIEGKLKEIPDMEKPKWLDYPVEGSRTFLKDTKLYSEQLAACKTYDTIKPNSFKEGEVYVEGKDKDYIIDNDYQCSRHTYLHPDEKCDGRVVAIATKKNLKKKCEFENHVESFFGLYDAIEKTEIKTDFGLLVNLLATFKPAIPLQEPTETEERRFTIKDMQDAIRFGADRGNTFCGFPSELNDYLTDEWKQYFKEKFNIDITRKH